MMLALAVGAGAAASAQSARLSTVRITTGVVTLTERTGIVGNSPVYVGDNLAGLTFFNGNPGIDGTPTNSTPGTPTSSVLFTLTGATIPGGAATDLHAFMGYGTLVGPPTQAVTYNDVAPLLPANTTYSGLTFAAPNLYPGGPAPLIANEFYMINHATNGTDYLAAISPATGGGSAVLNIKPMSWAGGTAGGPSSLGTAGYFALTFAAPAPTSGYAANSFYYLRTDTSFSPSHTKFGYVIPALVSGSLDTFDLTTAVGGFGAGGYTTLAFSDTAVGGYAVNQFYYLRQDTGVGGTGNTILGRLDTTAGNRTISDISNLGGVFRTLTFALDTTGVAPTWGGVQFHVAGAPLAAGAQTISFAAIADQAIGIPFTVTPSASSTLALTLTVVPTSTGTALITGPIAGVFTVTPLSPGIVTLQAKQAGNAAPFFTANWLNQSFNVGGLVVTSGPSPTPQTISVGGSATFTVVANGSPAPTTYDWKKNGVSLTNSAGHIAGATTSALTISNAIVADTDTNYTVTVGNGITTVNSGPGSLTVTSVPVPVITSSPSAAGTAGSAFSYSITATGAPTSYAATTLPTNGLSLNTTTGVISGTPVAFGQMVMQLTATNSAGTSLPFTLTITVAAAGVAPVITSSPTAAGTAGTPFSYSITATGTPTSYAASTLPTNGLVIDTTTGIISGTPTASGQMVMQLTATNSTGTSLPFTLTITVSAAGVAPVINPPFTAAGTAGTPFSYSITATGSPIAYASGTLPDGLVLNLVTGVISGTPSAAAIGVLPVTISATNAFGTGSATLTFTIAAAGSAPVINSPSTAAGTAGTPFSYAITATGTPTSYEVVGLPSGLSFNAVTGVIGGTPTGAGVSTVTLRATNSSGTGTATLTITIGASGIGNTSSPTITSPTIASATVGVPFSTYVFTATNSPTSYGASNLPAGLSINSLTGAISGTATTAGTSVVGLSATNSNGTGTATLTITVAPAGTVPVNTSPDSAAGTLGSPFSYNITATGLPTSYGATNLPPGLSLDGLTGRISGTPTVANTTFATLTATNSTGTGTSTLMIVIAGPSVAPIISSPTSVAARVGTPFPTYQIIASGSPTSYSATGLPPGLTINSLTGAINGTPTTAGTYNVTVTATNSSGTTSSTVTITVAGAALPPSSRIINFSARAISGPGEQSLILGFVVSGDGKDLLVRGIGPGLAQYGVVNVLVDPLLTLFNSTGVIATNDDWQTTAVGQANGTLVAATAARVGAFALPNGSKDSALLAQFNNGAHTTTMLRPNSGTGVALTEIYDTDIEIGPRLVNVSARMNVTPGEGTLIAGVVIGGTIPKTLLIRGVGPGLSAFGVAGVLADPSITVYSGTSTTQVGANDNWGTGSNTAAQLITATAQAGAFALTAGSRDAALLVTLQPGNYTVHVTGVGNTSGVALVEIYDTQ